MKTETTIVGHGENGSIRLAVLLPNSDIDAGSYTQYHSGYFIAEETRVRLKEAVLANYGGYELGDVISRDYGEGYTIYTVEITPKMPLETRARLAGYFPLPISATAYKPFNARFCEMPILPFETFSRSPCGKGI